MMANIRDLWSYRQLIGFFVWRDLIIRYRQTFFGILWLVLRPLVMTGLLVYLFGNQNRLTLNNQDYIAFVLTGYLCWQFFATSANDAGNSLINNLNSITKVYFPRMVLPLSVTFTNLIELLLSLTLAVVYLLLTNSLVSFNLFYLLIGLLLLITVTAGINLIISSLLVVFRDLKYLLPFLLQAGILLAPIGFTAKTFFPATAWLFFLNPVTAPMEIIRFSLIKQSSYLLSTNIIIGLTETLVLLTIGWIIFTRIEKDIADII